MNWPIFVHQAGNTITLDFEPIFAVPSDVLWVDLYAFPAKFMAANASDGPKIELGSKSGLPPHSYDIPPTLAYGPYLLLAVARTPDKEILGVSEAVWTVLRDQEKAYQVTLKREAVGDAVQMTHDLTGYRLKVSVMETTGIPKALFLHRKSFDGVGRLRDEFLGVCRPPDFADYPENEPDDGAGKYRKDVIDVVTHHSTELESMWRAVSTDVTRLVDTMEANRRLEDVEVVAL
jgi:hypothetical protein